MLKRLMGLGVLSIFQGENIIISDLNSGLFIVRKSSF